MMKRLTSADAVGGETDMDDIFDSSDFDEQMMGETAGAEGDSGAGGAGSAGAGENGMADETGMAGDSAARKAAFSGTEAAGDIGSGAAGESGTMTGSDMEAGKTGYAGQEYRFADAGYERRASETDAYSETYHREPDFNYQKGYYAQGGNAGGSYRQAGNFERSGYAGQGAFYDRGNYGQQGGYGRYENYQRQAGYDRQESEPESFSSEPYHSPYDAYRFQTPADVPVTLESSPRKKNTWLKVLLGIVAAVVVVTLAGFFGYKTVTGRSLLADVQKTLASWQHSGNQGPKKEVVLGAPKPHSESGEAAAESKADTEDSAVETDDSEAGVEDSAVETDDAEAGAEDSAVETDDSEAGAEDRIVENDGAEADAMENTSESERTQADAKNQAADTEGGHSKRSGSGHDGSGAYIGITCMTMPEAYTMNGYPSGVYVMDVNKEGPADRGGIIEGDILTSIGETDLLTKEDLIEALTHYSSGDVVSINVSRYSEDAGSFDKLTLEVTLGARKDMPDGSKDSSSKDNEKEEDAADSEEKIAESREAVPETGLDDETAEEKASEEANGQNSADDQVESTSEGDSAEVEKPDSGIPGGNYRKG